MQLFWPEEDGIYITMYIFQEKHVDNRDTNEERKENNPFEVKPQLTEFNAQLPGEIQINSHLLVTFFFTPSKL